MHETLEQLGGLGIIPVVVIDDANNAGPLAEALAAGGLPCMEVTFRTEAAQRAIAGIAALHPEVLLGAGTVLTVDQVKAAVDAGARFIVSPGLNRKVVEYCCSNDVPVTPGIATPTEIEMALDVGLQVVKFFPAEANGGVEFLKAISAPYKSIKFIPTGGIDESNLLGYLRLPFVHACGGSWMVKAEMIREKKFNDIRLLTTHAVATMLGFHLRHVGITDGNAEDAENKARAVAKLFDLPEKESSASLFVGTELEFLKTSRGGERGHIVIGTNSVERAVAFLGRRGVGIKPDTRVEKDGKLATVHLDLEVGGFALRLVQV